MAVHKQSQYDYQCLTTDTKPTTAQNGATLLVLDATTDPKSGDSVWVCHDNVWYKIATL